MSSLSSQSSPGPATASSTLARVLIATAVIGAVGLALRLLTGVHSLPPVWDEPLMLPVIQAIAEGGWTVENLIDYQDTKGPAFFWLYAAGAELVGAAVQDVRLITLAIFVATGIPWGLLASRCGLGRGATAATAALFALLPYHAVLGQLFMSETSFVFGLLLVVWSFLYGMDERGGARARGLGPVLFGVLLVVLLHHRPHVVAVAGAVVLTATLRHGRASWPWWAAAGVAGVLRLPLYARWGGLVTSEYQYRLGLGLRMESLTYVAIALLPVTAVLLWRPLVARGERGRRERWWIGGGAALGLLLGAVAMPDLSLTVDEGRARFMGMTATVLRGLPTGAARAATIALAGVGVAALAALAAIAVSGARPGDGHPPRRLVESVAAWSVLAGWALYALTRGAVFDRYLLPFVMLMPFVWHFRVPRVLIGLQAVLLVGLLARLAHSWLG